MSVKVDGSNITIPKGDSAKIAITPYVAGSDEVYYLREGEHIVFAVHSYDCREMITEKSSDLQDENGAVVFSLSPKETDIPRGYYRWTAKLTDDSGEIIDTFIGGIMPVAFYVK